LKRRRFAGKSLETWCTKGLGVGVFLLPRSRLDTQNTLLESTVFRARRFLFGPWFKIGAGFEAFPDFFLEIYFHMNRIFEWNLNWGVRLRKEWRLTRFQEICTYLLF